MVDFTNITNVTNPGQIVDFVNYNTGNAFMMFTTITLFFIMLMLTKKYAFNKSLLVSSWSAFLMSVFFMFAGWLNFFPVPSLFLVLSAITLGSMVWKEWG